ncbi:tetratricopeptide repeat protein [Arenimonas sp.]|uniref:tetratricopeptide repeat protein n=1 Tax=Arenimonas sp. TaxID=1872635 RepID=UPI0035B11FD1
MTWSKSRPIALLVLALAGATTAAAQPADVLEPVMAGEFALQAGDFGQAAGHYLRAAQASRDPGLVERAARVALLAGQSESAAAAIARWRELVPGSLPAAAAAIQLALDQGDAEAAGIEAARLMDPDNPAGFPVLLSALGDAREGRAAVARKVLRGLYETNRMPSSLGGWLAVAGLARRLEDRPLAERLVVEGVERFPEDPRALLLESARLREQGRDEAAREQLAGLGDPAALAPELRRAAARQYALLGDRIAAAATLGHGPQDEETLRQRARWLIADSDRKAIGGLYAEIADMDAAPGPERRLLLGLLAESLRRWTEAEAWYRSVPRGPGHDQAMLRLAGAEGRLGRYDEALATLHELQVDQAADGEYIRDAYLLEAELLERRDRGDEALASLGRALEVFESDPALLYARAMLHERAGRIDASLADLQLILDDHPDSHQALNAYGYALAVHREAWSEALPYLERALELSPGSGAILDSVGWVHFKLGRHDSALKLLRQAWAARRDPEIAAHLGEVLWQLGQRGEARDIWNAGLRLDPDHSLLKQTLESHAE